MVSSGQAFTLPVNFRPRSYEISLSNLDHRRGIFTGHVKIHFSCNKPSKKIHLNVRDLIIDSAEITLANDGRSLQPLSCEANPRLEAIILNVAEPITSNFSVDVDYRGVIQNNMSGFYRSKYKEHKTGKDKVMLSTQFEATDARGAFPCVDEPAQKATFKVSITAEECYTVLSNMPEEKRSSRGSQVEHIFHKTPLMPTYLVAWAIGEFEFIEGKTKKEIYPTLDQYSIVDGSSKTKAVLPIRIYTSLGRRNQGMFALSVATKAVDLFSELFKIPYPLPKLDLLCVESYSHNAMENFSLITFRPSALLTNYKNGGDSNFTALEKVAYVVCHEIAHQWFGNLVTMQWWDELWLNEGFATWVGWYAVSLLFPHWDVYSIVMLRSHETALTLDALRESHPVKVTLRDPRDIDQVFDTISYLKGCSVLEMVSGYLGEEDFLAGVALYLERNKWSNATMEDLFDCIYQVSHVNMLENIRPWLLESGYPLLTVTESNNKLNIRQRQYSVCEEIKQTKSWWVPLLLTRDDEFLRKLDFTGKSIECGAGSKFTLLNTDGAAFYRVIYETPKLMEALCDNLINLSSRSKMSLVADVFALRPLANFLHLVSRIMMVHNSEDVYVWKMVNTCLMKIRSIMFSSSEPKLLANFDLYVLRLIDPWIEQALEYFGNFAAMSKNQEGASCPNPSMQFYESILTTAGKLSHSGVVQAARALFLESNLDASNRAIVLGTVLSQPDTTRFTFDRVVEWLDKAVLEEVEIILRSLGGITNPHLFESCFVLLFKIEQMNVQFLAEGWKDNPHIHSSILQLARQYERQLLNRLSVNQVIIGRFIGFTFGYFRGQDSAQQLKLIFEGFDISAFDRVLNQTLELIEGNTCYYANNASLWKEFFK